LAFQWATSLRTFRYSFHCSLDCLLLLHLFRYPGLRHDRKEIAIGIPFALLDRYPGPADRRQAELGAESSHLHQRPVANVEGRMWADIHNLHLAGFGIALLLGNQFALRLENEVPTRSILLVLAL